MIKKFNPSAGSGQIAFTLIELLVVIVIIGILASLTAIGLSNVRAKARDSRRIGDVKQMQTALELYFADNGVYPAAGASAGMFEVGKPLISSSSPSVTYIKSIPTNPTPVTDGACAAGTEYVYGQVNSGLSYTLNYCLGGDVSGLGAGTAIAIPNIIKASSVVVCSCVGYCTGNDGCGNSCPNNCSVGNYCSANTRTCSVTPNYTAECDAYTSLGTACGGGWLICKPNGTGDSSCSASNTNYVVVAPTESGTAYWTTATTTCNSYSNAGYGAGLWSLPPQCVFP